MHLKTTFFLLLALVLAASVYWLVDREREGSEPPAAEKTLLAIEPEKITYVSFFREGEFIECVNDRGQWMLQKPVAARADSACMDRILAGFEMLPRGEMISAAQRQARGLTLEDYGLAKPRARIVLGSGAKRILLAVGGEASLKNAVYVRLDQDDLVVATSTNLLEIMPRGADALRDPSLLAGAPAFVQRLEIKRADGPLVQLAKEGAEWVIHKPVLARADWMKVSRLLDQVFALTVSRFVMDRMGDPAAYGLDDEEAVLQLGIWQADDKTEARLAFGKKADERGGAVYAARLDLGALVTVGRDRLEALLAAAADLRDSRLYFMAPETMGSIRIEEGERALEFRKGADSAWWIVEPRQWKADGRAMADLISRLNTFRFDPVAEGTNGAAVESEAPAYVLRVAGGYAAGGGATQGVALAAAPPPAASGERAKRALMISALRPGQEFVLARFEGEAPVYRISASAVSTLSLDPLSYRDSAVLALDPSLIRRITLRKDGGEQIVEQAETGLWQPAAPAGGELQRGALSDLLARTAELKALRFERGDSRNLAVYGLSEGRAVLTFSLTGEGGVQKVIVFGDPSEDLGVYAMVQGQDLVFVLEKTLADGLRRDLVR